MISEREELSREIRKALGRCNDNDRPVTVLVSESIAALTAQAERIEELEEEMRWQVRFLDAHAERLDGWAEDSVQGGWSTHQVAANTRAAAECRKMAAKARAMLEGKTS